MLPLINDNYVFLVKEESDALILIYIKYKNFSKFQDKSLIKLYVFKKNRRLFSLLKKIFCLTTFRKNTSSSLTQKIFLK